MFVKQQPTLKTHARFTAKRPVLKVRDNSRYMPTRDEAKEHDALKLWLFDVLLQTFRGTANSMFFRSGNTGCI